MACEYIYNVPIRCVNKIVNSCTFSIKNVAGEDPSDLLSLEIHKGCSIKCSIANCGGGV